MTALGSLSLAACLMTQPIGLQPTDHAHRPIDWPPKLSFAAASAPFRRLAHNLCGYVDARGTVRNQGLAPASYVSVVLHRMRFGARWLDHYRTDVHQWRGPRIAANFNLNKQTTLTNRQIRNADKRQEIVAAELLRRGRVYLFHVQRHGRDHVGFVRVDQQGSLQLSHFSGLKVFARHASGAFHLWYRISPFRGAPVSLYLLPRVEER